MPLIRLSKSDHQSVWFMKLIPWNNCSLIKCLPMDIVAGMRVSNVMIYALQKSRAFWTFSLCCWTLKIFALDLLSLSLASLWNLCFKILLPLCDISWNACTKEWLLYNTPAISHICHLPWYVLSLLVCLLYIFFFSIRVTCFFCTYSFFPMNQLNCVKIVNEQWDSKMSQTSRPSRKKKNMNQNPRRRLIQIFIHLMIADWNNFIAVNISLTKKKGSSEVWGKNASCQMSSQMQKLSHRCNAKKNCIIVLDRALLFTLHWLNNS